MVSNSQSKLAQLTVASLFAGLGGFATAFKREQYKSIWANELDKFAMQTFRLNNPDTVAIESDVRDFDPAGKGLPPPDVLTAGFPCQPFSSAGERLGLEDDRGMLYREIVRIVAAYGDDRPAVLLLENVSNLLGHDGSRTFDVIANALRQAGYWVLPHNIGKLNTRLHTDIPQNRERVFIVALSTSVFKGGRFEFPQRQSSTRPVSDFVDLSKQAEDYYYFDVVGNRFGEMIAHRVASGDASSIYQLRRSYVREYPNFVPTLTANMGDGGHNVPVVKDRWGIRKLTPSECAALQGFVGVDARFPPELSRVQTYKQIGNSVTVPLVQKLARACEALLRNAAIRRT